MVALGKFLPLFVSTEQGAYAPLFATASDNFTREKCGEYWESATQMGKMTSKARDKDLAKALWEWTEREMKQKGFL